MATYDGVGISGNLDQSVPVGSKGYFAVAGAGVGVLGNLTQGVPNGTKGYFAVAGNGVGLPMSSTPTQYTHYAFIASNTVAPNGFITWVNTTGDDTNKPNPGGITGASYLLSTWTAPT